MRTFPISKDVWITLLLVSTLAACGQNPHIVGSDPSIAGPVRGPSNNPHEEPGTGGKEDPKNCVRTTVAYFAARPLRADEAGLAPADATFLFATDVNLEARDSVKELLSVKMSILNGPTDRGAGQDKLCLVDQDDCANLNGQNLAQLDLGALFKKQDWMKVLYPNGTLRWALPSSWAGADVLLQVQLVADHCGGPK
jgi:hypothetical protein